MGRDERADWAQWWGEAWEDAHPAWRNDYARQAGLAPDLVGRLTRYRREAFFEFAGVYPLQPPPPDLNTLGWLALEPGQCKLAISLVKLVCSPTVPTVGVGTSHEAWCRSLAKALRPGQWLPEGANEPLELLSLWVGARCWARLRLQWPPDMVDAVRQSSLHNKPQILFRLQTLWPAVLWRVATC